jgi:hypothetical protein
MENLLANYSEPRLSVSQIEISLKAAPCNRSASSSKVRPGTDVDIAIKATMAIGLL